MEYKKGDKVNYKGRVCEVECWNQLTNTVSLVDVSEVPHVSLVTPVDAIEKFVNTLSDIRDGNGGIVNLGEGTVKELNDRTNMIFKLTEPVNQSVEKWRETVGDPVNPNHYILDGVDSFAFQKAICKRVPGDHGLCVFNVVKYLIRYRFKNGLEDLKKASWYLEALIKIVEEENNV